MRGGRAALALLLGLLLAGPALAQQPPPLPKQPPPASGDCGCGSTTTRGGPR